MCLPVCSLSPIRIRYPRKAVSCRRTPGVRRWHGRPELSRALRHRRNPGRLDLTPPPLWRIHRAIGMGGDKLVAQLTSEEVEHEHGDDLRDSWRAEYLDLRAEVVA